MAYVSCDAKTKRASICLTTQPPLDLTFPYAMAIHEMSHILTRKMVEFAYNKRKNKKAMDAEIDRICTRLANVL